MPRIVLILEYRGTAYAGWQRQANARSVQGAIEAAIEKAAGRFISVSGSGRTDAGVHALGQAAHFDYDGPIPVSSFLPLLNSLLPSDISVKECFPAPRTDFHVRFSAREKTYLYKCFVSPVRLATLFDTHYIVKNALDLDKMREAAALMLGERDFKAYSATGSKPKSTVRRLRSAIIRPGPDAEFVPDGKTVTAGEIHFEFTADGFLYNMVRVMVSELLKAGLGLIKPDRVTEVLAGKDRSKAKELVPPQGLYLKEVRY